MTTANNTRVLAIGAHPDDIEALCAGTLALLHSKGWSVECATMTPGDCGSATMSRGDISAIRRKEAAAAAAMLNGRYQCLELDDIFISYDRPTLLKVIRLIRQVQPAIVFTMSPQDYMVDHEITSLLVQTACFTAGMKNIDTGDMPPFAGIPHLYYCDPIDGKGKFGEEIEPGILVDVSAMFSLKEQMFRCHQSQLAWLKGHHGVDDFLRSVRELAEKRGKQAGVRYAEGFRKHLGHAFPQGNILMEVLGADVVKGRSGP
jgi:LmbE family N-acetylglucosaminyl deacetylase